MCRCLHVYDLLPTREAPYQAASLKRIKEEVAAKAGMAEADVAAHLDSANVLNNTAYILPSVDPAIVAVLNSPLAWWFMWRTAQHGKDEVLRLIHSYIGEYPIPNVPQPAKGSLVTTVTELAKEMANLQAFEDETESLAVKCFSLLAPDGKVAACRPLQFHKFSSRILKLAGVKQSSPKVVEEMETFHRKQRTRQVELLTRQLALEQTLAGMVENAYGLNPEERSLLRATRPVRDPLDVLEAKIQGGEVEEPTTANE